MASQLSPRGTGRGSNRTMLRSFVKLRLIGSAAIGVVVGSLLFLLMISLIDSPPSKKKRDIYHAAAVTVVEEPSATGSRTRLKHDVSKSLATVLHGTSSRGISRKSHEENAVSNVAAIEPPPGIGDIGLSKLIMSQDLSIKRTAPRFSTDIASAGAVSSLPTPALGIPIPGESQLLDFGVRVVQIKNACPRYPETPSAGMFATLVAIVGTDGKVTNVNIQNTNETGQWLRAEIAAVKRFRFEPFVLSGKKHRFKIVHKTSIHTYKASSDTDAACIYSSKRGGKPIYLGDGRRTLEWLVFFPTDDLPVAVNKRDLASSS